MDAAEQKYIQRREGIRARGTLPAEYRRQASLEVCAKIGVLEAFRRAKTVMVYSAVKAELDLSSLAQAALKAGKRVLYPCCIEGGKMLALEPAGRGSWKTGSFGIPEPDPTLCRQAGPAEIDLVVCPCTAFDEGCMRIGMGGGYYDRFLAACAGALKIAAAFEAQKSPEIASEAFDVRMDAVVTEKSVYKASQAVEL